jgi:4-hydroxy-3-polyprenylbenzoate decarboxylase
MSYKDLRTFIGELDKAGELVRIKPEVDWDGEVGAIARAAYKRKGPAMLFENVKGSKIPLFCGAMQEQRKFGMMIDCRADIRTQIDFLTGAMAKMRDPVVITGDAACQENVLLRTDIDLGIFPSPRWHPKDGGRYIGTLGCIVSKDPDTGIRNVAVVREMVEGRNKVGVNCEQHNGVHLRKYRDRGEPMPFATAIGVPPAVLVAAIAKSPYGVDEYGVAGGIAGEPIPLVNCKTVDLEVPADAEIVLEGHIDPDTSTWELEGPFGEFTGHFSSQVATKKPTGVLTAITYRNSPIMQGTSPGVGPNEMSLVGTMVFAPAWKASLLAAGIPGVKDLNVMEMGCAGFICVVSLSKSYYAGNAQQVMSFLQCLGHFPKITICVDEDIDVFDTDMVLWALASRVQPHRDVDITLPNYFGCSLDPSIPDRLKPMPTPVGSRMMIDATKSFKEDVVFSPLVVDDETTKRFIASRWREYGFSE